MPLALECIQYSLPLSKEKKQAATIPLAVVVDGDDDEDDVVVVDAGAVASTISALFSCSLGASACHIEPCPNHQHKRTCRDIERNSDGATELGRQEKEKRDEEKQ